MTEPTDARLRANAKYEKKLTRINVTFNRTKDFDNKVLTAVREDKEPFVPLVKKLLAEHYDLTE